MSRVLVAGALGPARSRTSAASALHAEQVVLSVVTGECNVLPSRRRAAVAVPRLLRAVPVQPDGLEGQPLRQRPVPG